MTNQPKPTPEQAICAIMRCMLHNGFYVCLEINTDQGRAVGYTVGFQHRAKKERIWVKSPNLQTAWEQALVAAEKHGPLDRNA